MKWAEMSACGSPARTPGACRALSTSSRVIRAWAREERSTFACSMPGNAISTAYSARPETLSNASLRGRLAPKMPNGAFIARSPNGGPHRTDDLGITGATTDIRTQPFDDGRAVGILMMREQRLGQQDH